MITERLHATSHYLGTTILYSLHRNIFNHHEIPPADKLSNVDSEKLDIFFTEATRCWAVNRDTDLKPAVVWYPLKSRLACTSCTFPLLDLKPQWEETDKVHTKFQSFAKITYVASSCNIDLLFPLLQLSACVQQEQNHWRISCCITATFHALVFQRWRLKPCTPTFKSHCWIRYRHC